MEELSVVLLSWTDHHLVGFRLTGTQNLCRGGKPLKMVHPRRLMDQNGFLVALGEFLVVSAGNSVELEMARTLDTISPKCLLP